MRRIWGRKTKLLIRESRNLCGLSGEHLSCCAFFSYSLDWSDSLFLSEFCLFLCRICGSSSRRKSSTSLKSAREPEDAEAAPKTGKKQRPADSAEDASQQRKKMYANRCSDDFLKIFIQCIAYQLRMESDANSDWKLFCCWKNWLEINDYLAASYNYYLASRASENWLE